MSFKRVVDGLEVVALVCAALFVVLLVANEGGSTGTPSATSPTSAERASGSVDGAALYARFCSSCHGPQGQGAAGPRLAGRVTSVYPDIEDQIAVIRDGSGLMPRFATSLSEAEMRAVAEHERQLPAP